MLEECAKYLKYAHERAGGITRPKETPERAARPNQTPEGAGGVARPREN